MKNPARAPSAFSLVELLVVVVILLALAGLMFPVLARAREQSRRTVCKSNLHQIGIALELYRQDYDGQDAQVGSRWSHSQLGLPYHFSMDAMYHQYTKAREVWFCPSFGGQRDGLGSSYAIAFLDSELLHPEDDYEAIASARGPDYPMVLCLDHNGPKLEQAARQTYESKIYHVLRIDGRVETRKVAYDTILDLYTW